MRKLTIKLIVPLVLLTNLIALAQYRSGPSDLTRKCGLTGLSNTNFAYNTNIVNVAFPCSGTNVDLTFIGYNADSSNILDATYTFQKSMNAFDWTTITTMRITNGGTAGDRLFYVTNISVGNYGYFRCSAVTNNQACTLSNLQVIATHK